MHTEKTVNVEERLASILPIFRMNKRELDSYKKIVDKYNAEIKELMTTNQLEEFIADNVKATCKVSYREEFNMDALLDGIRALNIPGIIKTQEYVDMDALESAIYNGKINAAELAPYRTRKEVVTLRVTDVK